MPDYSKEDENTRCDELRETFPNDIIFSASVGMTDKLPQRILDAYDDEVEIAAAEIPPREPKKKVRMVMNWKQSKSNRDWWINKKDGGWVTLQRKWNNINSDIDIFYEEMELSVDDKKGASDIALGDED